MAYVAPADMRSGTALEFAKPWILTTAEASDVELTAAITRISEWIDTITGDHFEATALTIDLGAPGDSDDSVWGVGGRRGPSRLYLPKRIRSVTSVSTRDLDGTITLEAGTVYRVHSSLNSAANDFADDADPYDYVEIIPGKDLSTGERVWPPGPATVRIIGAWDWASTPKDIQRVIAILVYDHFKPETESLRRAEEWATETARYSRGKTTPTGLPDVDEVLARYARPDPVAF